MADTFVWHEDSGHAWLAVPHAIIEKLGIACDISRYSYSDSRMVYLEEDCDAPLFLRACERDGVAYTYRRVHMNGDSWIRSLAQY